MISVDVRCPCGGGGTADEPGVVEFRSAGGAGVLYEPSRFVRERGRRVHLDGDLVE